MACWDDLSKRIFDDKFWEKDGIGNKIRMNEYHWIFWVLKTGNPSIVFSCHHALPSILSFLRKLLCSVSGTSLTKLGGILMTLLPVMLSWPLALHCLRLKMVWQMMAMMVLAQLLQLRPAPQRIPLEVLMMQLQWRPRSRSRLRMTEWRSFGVFFNPP